MRNRTVAKRLPAPSSPQLLAQERGTLHKNVPKRLALMYPSPYHAAMSSLGYQTVYRFIHEKTDWAADRAMLPDDLERTKRADFRTLETDQMVSNYRVLAFSVAYELEIAGLIQCLELAGIPPLAQDRNSHHPIIVAGGPLTFSNPVPLAPFCDIICMGEAEGILPTLLAACENDRAGAIQSLAGVNGFYIPTHDGDTMPEVAQAPDCNLPARSQILTPNTELSNMFLTEAARGCSRGCTYCVMRRTTNGGMRTVAPETIWAGIPDDAKRVGLVGAAVTDHPHIARIVEHIVEGGKQIGISSLRADRLTDDLVKHLARGGYKTLTVAADGASERMRRYIERSTKESHLLNSAELAKKHGLRTLKLYMMVGVPTETDEDIDELAEFCGRLSAVHSRIALGVAPFVAKRNTPLDGMPFAGIDLVENRLKRLREKLQGRAEVRATSARWAWVEYMLAQSTSVGGLAVLDAVHQGGSFAAYKAAFLKHNVTPTGPVARVMSSAEVMAKRAQGETLARFSPRRVAS